MNIPTTGPLSYEDDYLELSVRQEDLDAEVLSVRFVVHTTGPLGNTTASDNHVTHYLLLARGRSVQINMRHTVDDLEGTLQITSRDYHQSNSTINFFPQIAFDGTTRSEQIRARFTPRDAITRIIRCGLQGFAFAGGGMGCRHWQIVVLAMYEERGWVRPGHALAFHAFASYQMSRLREPQRIRIRHGTFDHEQTQQLARQAWTILAGQARGFVQAGGDRAAGYAAQLGELQRSLSQGEALLEQREQED